MPTSSEMRNIYRRQSYDALLFLQNADQLLNREFISHGRLTMAYSNAITGVGYALVAIFNLLDNHFNSEE